MFILKVTHLLSFNNNSIGIHFSLGRGSIVLKIFQQLLKILKTKRLILVMNQYLV